MDPNPALRLKRANALNDYSRFVAAEAEVRLALAGEVDRSAAYEILAVSLLGQQKIEEADGASARSIAENPQRASACYVRAVVLRMRGDLTGAQTAVQKALQRVPLPHYFAELTRIYLDAKRPADALQAAETGLKYGPECLVLCQVYTIALARVGRLWAARESAAHTITLAPENPIGYIQLANIEYAQADLPAAEEHYRQALRLNPRAADVKTALLNTVRAQSWPYRRLIANQASTASDGHEFFVRLFPPVLIAGAVNGMSQLTLPIILFASSVLLIFPYVRCMAWPLSTLVACRRECDASLFSQRDRVGSIVAVASAICGLSCLAFAVLERSRTGAFLGIMLLLVCVPITGLSLRDPKKDRKTLRCAVGLCALYPIVFWSSRLLAGNVDFPALFVCALLTIVFAFTCKLTRVVPA